MSRPQRERMRVIVQKFGGSSLSTPERRQRLVQRVLEARRAGFAVVVVVSAMGRQGDPYATDTLIQMAKTVHEETSPRELDLLSSCGEIISAVVVTNTLKKAGIPAMVLTGGQAGIVTDESFTDARILRVEPDHLLRHLREGRVMVVAGFQGVTEKGDITTLGRGGSDTTAAALGAALGAEVVEVYTDVDGVKTADPRYVPEARTLDVVTYDEVAQMAHEGARVVHPRAVEIAMRANVPLRVRSTFDDFPGTLVTNRYSSAQTWPDLREARVITGVTYIPDLARVEVEVQDTEDQPEPDQEARMFRRLADAGVSVDVINVSPGRKAFCVVRDALPKAERILRGLGFEPDTMDGCAKVSVVGTGMRGLPGVMANVVEALREAGVRILLTADSHVTISCVVRQEDMEAALNALHRRFGLDRAGDGDGGDGGGGVDGGDAGDGGEDG